MRNAARQDANQPEIVAGLRAAGYAVYILGMPVDLLIGWGGTRSALLEIKTKDGKLTEFQEKFIPDWPGPIGVVRSLDEAIEFLEGIK